MNWCSDGIFTNPLRYCLAANVKEYRWALKESRVDAKSADPFDDWEGGVNARVMWFGPGSVNDDRRTSTAVVCINPDLEGRTGTEIAAILVHEAVHIWQRICLVLGEKDPSKEFEAYSIQWIAQNLMCQYRDRNVK